MDGRVSLALSVALVIIAFAAAFHLHWALGGRLGYSVSLPQTPDGRPVLPHRLPLWRPAAFCVGVGLLVLAALALARAELVALPLGVGRIRWALSLVGTAFVLRAVVPNRYVGFFKRLRSTRWARYDTRLYSPLFLLLGLALLRPAA